jgi:hypothetical protein
MGETENLDEFINPDNGEIDTGARIRFGESWQPTIDKYEKLAEGMSLTEVAAKSRNKQEFDFKWKEGDSPDGISTGRLLNGKYATARSAGNYMAGYNAATRSLYGYSVSKDQYIRLAGAYQAGAWDGKNKATAIFIMLGAGYGSAPYYGEIPYSGRMQLKGFDAGYSKTLLKKIKSGIIP